MREMMQPSMQMQAYREMMARQKASEQDPYGSSPATTPPQPTSNAFPPGGRFTHMGNGGLVMPPIPPQPAPPSRPFGHKVRYVMGP